MGLRHTAQGLGTGTGGAGQLMWGEGAGGKGQGAEGEGIQNLHLYFHARKIVLELPRLSM